VSIYQIAFLVLAGIVTGVLLTVYLAGVAGRVRNALREEVTSGVAIAATVVGVTWAMTTMAVIFGFSYLYEKFHVGALTGATFLTCWVVHMGAIYFGAKKEKPSSVTDEKAQDTDPAK